MLRVFERFEADLGGKRRRRQIHSSTWRCAGRCQHRFPEMAPV